jgi:O-antigen/teichoic acid export membrane protein
MNAMTPEPDAAARTTGASLFSGSIWNSVAGLLPQVYTLAVSISAARFLGPDAFGRQSFIAFVGLSLALVLTAGLSIALMRSVAETIGRGEPGQARGLLRWARRPQAAAGLLSGGSMVVAGLAGAEPGLAWALAGASTLFVVLHTVPSAGLFGSQRFRDAAIVGLVVGAATVPVMIAVLAAGGGIAGLFAVEAAAGAINLAWTWKLARRAMTRLAPQAERPPAALRHSTALFARWTTVSMVLSLVVWRRSEFLFLAEYSSDKQIGFYSIAFAATTALSMLAERLAVVVSSAFATLHGAAAVERLRSGFKRGLRLLVILSLPVAALAATVGPEAISVGYGRDFEDAGPVLVILALALPAFSVWTISGALLTGLDDARSPVLASGLAAALNLALAFALVPGYDAIGAAIANVAAQVLAAAVMLRLASRAVQAGSWDLAALIRPLLAAAGAGLVAWAVLQGVTGVPGVVLASLGGGLAYAALAFLLRILTADDAAWLDDQIGHRLGGRMGRMARLAGRRVSEAAA